MPKWFCSPQLIFADTTHKDHKSTQKYLHFFCKGGKSCLMEFSFLTHSQHFSCSHPDRSQTEHLGKVAAWHTAVLGISPPSMFLWLQRKLHQPWRDGSIVFSTVRKSAPGYALVLQLLQILTSLVLGSCVVETRVQQEHLYYVPSLHPIRLCHCQWSAAVEIRHVQVLVDRRKNCLARECLDSLAAMQFLTSTYLSEHPTKPACCKSCKQGWARMAAQWAAVRPKWSRLSDGRLSWNLARKDPCGAG